MLFRPQLQNNLDAIALALSGWNAEADHFRNVARSGEAQPLTIAAARDALDGLNAVIDGMDDALLALAPGHPGFGPLLTMLNAATALRESITRSLDTLEADSAEAEMDGPVHIVHEMEAAWVEPWRIAAE